MNRMFGLTELAKDAACQRHRNRKAEEIRVFINSQWKGCRRRGSNCHCPWLPEGNLLKFYLSSAVTACGEAHLLPPGGANSQYFRIHSGPGKGKSSPSTSPCGDIYLAGGGFIHDPSNNEYHTSYPYLGEPAYPSISWTGPGQHPRTRTQG